MFCYLPAFQLVMGRPDVVGIDEVIDVVDVVDVNVVIF